MSDRFNIGDLVEINVGESRKEGYNFPYPDGTLAHIKRFTEIELSRVGYGRPGVYVNKSYAYIDIDGKEENIGTFYLKVVTPAEPDHLDFLRPLPETKFYEGDIVKVNPRRPISSLDKPSYTICRINYNYIGRLRNDGITPMSIYEISDTIHGGWWMSFQEDELELIERGNIYKYYHNIPITFGSVEEEANFNKAIGNYTEICNPKTSLYSWTLPEILEAIKAGLADAFSVSLGMFGSTKPYHTVIKFNNKELGKKVAALTLEGFKPDIEPKS